MKEALFYEKKENDKVQCFLCPHDCVISDDKTGICRVRINKGGTLYSAIYEEVTSISMDPIEKKPLYHFYPGSHILSIGTNGCNLRCSFCQNWSISQVENSGREKITSERLIVIAKKEKSIGIAYTYNEPFIWYEFVIETARTIKKNGLNNVLVTNGFINEKPLVELLPYIDAMNIDIKSIKDDFYKDVCKGRLNPVKRTIEISAKKCHIELTNLIIPGLNDTREEIQELVDWIASVDSEMPFHISKYFPQYRADNKETPEETLKMAEEIAKKKLKYVYIGNIYTSEGNVTFCPGCKKRLLVRRGYKVLKNEIKDMKCKYCNYIIKGVFEKKTYSM